VSGLAVVLAALKGAVGALAAAPRKTQKLHDMCKKSRGMRGGEQAAKLECKP